MKELRLGGGNWDRGTGNEHKHAHTHIRRYEPKVNLSGMKGTVIAEFFEIDDKNAVALNEGRSFRADRMVLRPDATIQLFHKLLASGRTGEFGLGAGKITDCAD